MIQFNINRFGKLAKWSLTTDKGYYLKCFLQALVVMTLLFLAFTTNFFRFNVNGIQQQYAPCCVVVMALFMLDIIMGPSQMFYSMRNKHDDQTLMMLPASNFEKYLMRYSTWIILLPLYLVAFLGADLIQYIVNMVVGHEGTTFVTAFMVDRMDEIGKVFADVPRGLIHMMIFLLLFTHSFYALGGTIFRSHKYAWILTTLLLIIIAVLIAWATPKGQGEFDEHTPTLQYVIWDAIYIGWLLLNFWLSYRIFCRTQVKGKFINK